MPLALMSFHHLRNPKKIHDLRSMTHKLRITGIFRRGWPGVLLVSHPDSIKVLDSFCREVKTWRWASATVCGIEEPFEIDWGHQGLEEVGKVRDVVRVADEKGGEDVKIWVMRGLGLGGGD